MVTQTDRFGLDQFDEDERYKEDGTAAGNGDPDGHNDTVRHVDAHTWLVTSQTSAYTASNYDAVLADVSGGGFSVTLPAASTDVHVIVKKTDSSSNQVTIATPNAETIDGQSSITLSTQFASRSIVSDGTNYFIV